MAQLALERVEKVYGDRVRAVDDFSLAVDDGELVVLVGPSGCGKTTLLRIVAGLETPTRGVVRLDGTAVNDRSPQDRNIAMVFQHGALYGHLDVYDNMAFSLRMRKVPKKAIRQRVREAAEMLGIERLLERRPHELSGGERQRVALGRAIVRRPACFLFDEPLSGLDAPRRAELRGEIKQLHRRLGITTVYVTHDQEEAMTLGERIAVIRQGRAEQIARPLDLYRSPASGFVARFIGSPRISLLSGRLALDGTAVWFESGEARLAIPDGAARGLGEHAGREVVLGLRPEAVSAATAGTAASELMTARVEYVEPRGDRLDVYTVTMGGERIVARLDAQADPPATGAEVPLRVEMCHAHFFAADREADGGAGERLGP